MVPDLDCIFSCHLPGALKRAEDYYTKRQGKVWVYCNEGNNILLSTAGGPAPTNYKLIAVTDWVEGQGIVKKEKSNEK